MPRRAAIGVLLAACLLLMPSGARAAEFTVNTTGDHAADACDATDCTVRDAIAAANAAAGADTITVPAGTYALSSGALVITDPVTISGPATAQPTAILDAAYSNRIFDVAATAGAVTIAHLRVTRAQSPDVTRRLRSAPARWHRHAASTTSSTRSRTTSPAARWCCRAGR